MSAYWDAYNNAESARLAPVRQQDQQMMGALQQAAQFQTLQGAIQEQQAKRAAMARDVSFRQRMSAATTDEERAQIAMEAEGAKGVLSHLDRKSRDASTAATNLSRLAQQQSQFDSNMQLRWSNAKDAREKALVEAQWKQGRLAIETAQAQIAGKNLQYNTGSTVDIPQTPQLTMPGAAPSPVVRGEAPDEAAAVAAINAGGGRPMSVEIPTGSPPMMQSPAAAAGIAPPVVAPAAPIQPAAPNNLDARDLRLQNAAPAPVVVPKPGQGVPGVREGQPAAPTLADAPAELSPRDKAKWLLQQTKPSISGAGKLTPRALEVTAQQYLAGDRQAVQGFARSTTERVALQNAIVDEAAKRGMSAEAIAAKMAEFAGTVAGSRTVGQRAANISLAATEAQQMLGIVKETSDKFARSDFVPWNMALKAFETNTGSPEIAEFGAAVNALVNVYARAINPTGVPTVSDKEHARSVLNTVQSPQQVDAVLGIIRRELEIAKKAPETVKEATREGIIGGGNTTQYPTATAPNGRKVIYKDGKWQTLQP